MNRPQQSQSTTEQPKSRRLRDILWALLRDTRSAFGPTPTTGSRTGNGAEVNRTGEDGYVGTEWDFATQWERTGGSNSKRQIANREYVTTPASAAAYWNDTSRRPQRPQRPPIHETIPRKSVTNQNWHQDSSSFVGYAVLGAALSNPSHTHTDCSPSDSGSVSDGGGGCAGC